MLVKVKNFLDENAISVKEIAANAGMDDKHVYRIFDGRLSPQSTTRLTLIKTINDLLQSRGSDTRLGPVDLARLLAEVKSEDIPDIENSG